MSGAPRDSHTLSTQNQIYQNIFMDGAPQTFRKVVLAGATGMLGQRILHALSASGRYDVTAIVRIESRLTQLPNVREVVVDFASQVSIVQAFEGHDVLVSALGKGALDIQLLLIDAAVIADIKRIIPSVFCADYRNPKTRVFPIYHPKVLVEEQLERYFTKSGVSYTFIFTNCFLDWALSGNNAFLLNPANRSVRLFDGGNTRFSTTTIATASQAVVAVLDHYDETANLSLYIHDVATTQNELLKMAKQVTAGDGGPEWTTSSVSTKNLELEAWRAFNEGGWSMNVFPGFAIRAGFAEGYGGHFEQIDNDLLEIPTMNQERLLHIVQEAVAPQRSTERLNH